MRSLLISALLALLFVAPAPASTPQPNTRDRANLIAFWNMRLYETVGHREQSARRLERRYWLWGRDRGANIEAHRYVRQRLRLRDGRTVIIHPPRRGTIGPVRYVYPHGWSPGFGQADPPWWDSNLGSS